MVPASRFARMADELAERGWSVQEQLLPEPLAQALERDCRALWQQDDLTPAAIGRGDGQLVMPGIRGDIRAGWTTAHRRLPAVLISV
ncbi:hypothetical protein ULF88_14010 [Halopseudomonas pachastrellae]|nr:hypothetical protein [Halopseudomonas pachastrellae]